VLSIYFGRPRSGRRNLSPHRQSVPDRSEENNSPRSILFNTTSSPPLHSPPPVWHLLANPSSLSDGAAHPSPDAAILCRPQAWTMTTAPPSLQAVVVFSHLPRAGSPAAVDLRCPLLPLVTDGPRVYFLHLGRRQAGRSSAHHRPSAPSPPQLA
jgi:hypothetical protein